jgi:hypothetical protein
MTNAAETSLTVAMLDAMLDQRVQSAGRTALAIMPARAFLRELLQYQRHQADRARLWWHPLPDGTHQCYYGAMPLLDADTGTPITLEEFGTCIPSAIPR